MYFIGCTGVLLLISSGLAHNIRARWPHFSFFPSFCTKAICTTNYFQVGFTELGPAGSLFSFHRRYCGSIRLLAL